jgi:hypothetical protein
MDKTLGQGIYEAHFKASKGISPETGIKMAHWPALDQRAKDIWEATGGHVHDVFKTLHEAIETTAEVMSGDKE